MRHPTTSAAGELNWRSIRVLLFSLDDGFRFLVRQTFRKLGVRDVLSTSVSADATPMMQQVPDIGLVDFDGDAAATLAFLERVRRQSATMPVLVVARPGETAGLDQALALGIEGVVPKQISGHELTHRVTVTLKGAKRLPPPATTAKPLPMPMPTRPPVVGAAGAAPGVAAGKAATHGATIKTTDAVPTARPGRSPGGGHYGDPAEVRPGGGRLDDDEGPAAPTARTGRLADDEVATAPQRGGPLETATPKPTAKDKAARLREDEAKARWQAELAEKGHQSRTGSDVAGLDVTAIVAAHLQWLSTQGAAGKRATFHRMDLAGGDLSGTVLANATFREADLSDASLAEARLDGADFRYAKLGAADLTGANLGVAQLRHADLRLANLQGATLRGADLSGARLGGAKLAGADFGGAVLVGSDLRGADLAQVENLTQGQVDKAECGPDSKLPPGILRPRPKD